jgi:hypothetical protein
MRWGLSVAPHLSAIVRPRDKAADYTGTTRLSREKSGPCAGFQVPRTGVGAATRPAQRKSTCTRAEGARCRDVDVGLPVVASRLTPDYASGSMTTSFMTMAYPARRPQEDQLAARLTRPGFSTGARSSGQGRGRHAHRIPAGGGVRHRTRAHELQLPKLVARRWGELTRPGGCTGTRPASGPGPARAVAAHAHFPCLIRRRPQSIPAASRPSTERSIV